jgi:hypothetical protein
VPAMKLELVPELKLLRLWPQLPQQEFCCRYYPLSSPSQVQLRSLFFLSGEGS